MNNDEVLKNRGVNAGEAGINSEEMKKLTSLNKNRQFREYD
jgi:hypothetical protein